MRTTMNPRTTSRRTRRNRFYNTTAGALALGLMLLAGGCSGGIDSVSEPVTLVFQLSTQASPAEGGSVSPQSGLVDIGTTLSVEATPNTGWAFEGWSGANNSEQNPLSVQVNSNVDLTANFRRIESIYKVSLTLSDNSGTLDTLEFGQLQEPASAGVPDAPPPPPGDVLSGWFEREGQRLYLDYRQSLELTSSWQLQVELGAGEQLDLSWSIESDLLEGSLSLIGPDGTRLADMLADSTAQINLTGGKGVLGFEYELD